jgi:ribosomal subunit interface protein
MEVHVRAPKFDLSEGAREYAETKIGRSVKKLMRGNARVDVEVTGEARGGTSLAKVKVQVAVPRASTAVITAEDADVRAAIDLAADKIGRALRRNKEKRRDKSRTGAHEAAVGPEVDEETDTIDV